MLLGEGCTAYPAHIKGSKCLKFGGIVLSVSQGYVNEQLNPKLAYSPKL